MRLCCWFALFRFIFFIGGGGEFPQSAQNFGSNSSPNVTLIVTNTLPNRFEVSVANPPQPPANAALEWAKATSSILAAVIAVAGIFLTAWVTLRRGRLDARFNFAAEVLEFRLRQIQEFYSPALLLVEQSRNVYAKMLWTVKTEKKDISLDGFRLLDHIFHLKSDKSVGPLVQRILEIGKQLKKLISDKAGLIEGGIAPMFSEYLAHFEILEAASEQNLSAEQKEGWHELGYYPRMLNREIREGYKVVLSHVEKYVAAGDKIILRSLGQENVELDKYRRQLIANLSYYEQHAKSYAGTFDGFDLGEIRKRFVTAVRENSAAKTEDGLEGRILDAGCGTGRDALEFIRLGYEVTALDPSPAMLRYCNRKIREAKLVKETERAAKASRSQEMTFDEISFRNEFDGVWAAASLLHVPVQAMPETLRILLRSLKPKGVLFFSMKYGTGEHEWDARFYTYYDRRAIREILQNIPQAREISIWLTDATGKELSPDEQSQTSNDEETDRHDRRLWLNVLVKKARAW